MVAAAIIFIPELLSGPKHTDAPREVATANSEGATRTYTIDLEHRSPTTDSATTPANETSAPPPEVAPESHVESSPEPIPAAPSIPEKPELAAPPNSVPVKRTEEPPRVITPSSERDTPKPQPKKATRTSGWAVQVGSFGTAATAERIAQQFEQKGFNAYTRSVQVDGKTWYRVRLGPAAERSDAEAFLKKVKGDQPNATLVSEP